LNPSIDAVMMLASKLRHRTLTRPERKLAHGRFSPTTPNTNFGAIHLAEALGGRVLMKRLTGFLSSFLNLGRPIGSTNLAGCDGSIGSR
jgi:hypothetical protein